MCTHQFINEDGMEVCSKCGVCGSQIFVDDINANERCSKNYVEYSRSKRAIGRVHKWCPNMSEDEKFKYGHEFNCLLHKWHKWNGKKRKYFFSVQLVTYFICNKLNIECTIKENKIMKDRRRYKTQRAEWDRFKAFDVSIKINITIDINQNNKSIKKHNYMAMIRDFLRR